MFGLSVLSLVIGFVGGVVCAVVVPKVYAFIKTVGSKATTIVADVKKDL